MPQDFEQIFSEITVVAKVVNTEFFRLSISHESEHNQARGHIAAEAKADENRNSFSGKLSIIFGDEALGVVRGSVPKQLEEDLSGRVGGTIRAKVKTCNFGTRVLESFENI